MWHPLKKNKALNLELEQALVCKDAILQEYAKIQHQYNNIFQNILCFIEEEDLESITKYKTTLLETTKLLNSNNYTQLIKLKDISIMNMIYMLLSLNTSMKSPLHLIIYNDVVATKIYSDELYKELWMLISHAYKIAVISGNEFTLKINGNQDGINFFFESTYSETCYENISELLETKNIHKEKNIFYNTFVEGDMLKQEISLSLI